MNDFEIEKYLNRIGPSLNKNMTTMDKLKMLHLHHPYQITFENIDSFTDTVPSLDLNVISLKVLENKRGGYCYEQNLLFLAVLQEIGIKPKIHLARVLWNNQNNQETPRTHMLLTANVEGNPFLIDVGFGSMTLTAPMQLNITEAQQTPNGIFRIVPLRGFYQLEVLKGEWLPIYRFSLEEVYHSDLEMANWYTATYLHSVFKRFLIISKVDELGRYSLFNNEFNIRWNYGKKESGRITSFEQLKDILSNIFNLCNLSNNSLEMIYNKLKEEPLKLVEGNS
ncbi:arylamine N-acetyltransferase family protein [Chryseobacterium tongliaoense]|uniref:arylamine N-acetyltransferase family protein n=1 Tax=Chryseobacterium tongliaoense TaxID=3240933 RepID=UPI003515032B